MLSQPPYSPDLAPCNFAPPPFCLQLKRIMKGCQFDEIEEIGAGMMRQMRTFPKSDSRGASISGAEVVP